LDQGEAIWQLASYRILIVDDFQPWRRFVASMLRDSPEFQIIGEAWDGLEAVRMSQELQPDLILLDVGLPKLNGIEAARRISAVAPDTTILFVSADQSDAVVQEAMRTGACARGYLLKSDAGRDLLPALQAVIEDRQFISNPLRLAFQVNGFREP
jgi:DNA-binding NarL/FixJ family response regulator